MPSLLNGNNFVNARPILVLAPRSFDISLVCVSHIKILAWNIWDSFKQVGLMEVKSTFEHEGLHTR